MAHRREKEMTQNERLQIILADMLKDDDNKYCADCDAKGPRWASWNLGVFLCIRCAGIHRNLGVHISRVKSVNLDTWTSEQVAMMQEIGNSRGRAIYEANLPDNFRRPQTDSPLEQLIRNKYEEKRYIAKEWVPPKPKSLTVHDEKRPGHNKRQRQNAKPVVDLTRPPITSSSAVPRPSTNGQVRSTAGTAIRRAQEQPQPQPQPTQPPPQPSHTVDLLGLDDPIPKTNNGIVGNGTDSDDLFGEFLSSAPATGMVANMDKTANVGGGGGGGGGGTSLEQDLFGGQQATVNSQGEPQQPQEPQKSTKESILALYGSQPALPSMASNQQPPPSQFMAMPPGMLHASASAPHMSAAYLAGGGNVPSGMMAAPQAMPANVPGCYMWAQSPPQQPQHSMFGAPAPTNGSTAVPQAMFGVQHNPFFAQQQQQQHQQMYLQQIQQQLSGMQLQPSSTPTAAPGPGQTLATNLWQ